MWMTLEVTCVSDTNESRITKFLDIWSTAISHTCTETTYELIYNLVEGTLVRNLSHDSLWNELLDVCLHILEVAVL
jgi:hypothetical protein